MPNPCAKLTWDKVQAIRASAATQPARRGSSLLAELAGDYGVARSTIASVLSGDTWRGVPACEPERVEASQPLSSDVRSTLMAAKARLCQIQTALHQLHDRSLATGRDWTVCAHPSCAAACEAIEC